MINSGKKAGCHWLQRRPLRAANKLVSIMDHHLHHHGPPARPHTVVHHGRPEAPSQSHTVLHYAPPRPPSPYRFWALVEQVSYRRVCVRSWRERGRPPLRGSTPPSLPRSPKPTQAASRRSDSATRRLHPFLNIRSRAKERGTQHTEVLLNRKRNCSLLLCRFMLLLPPPSGLEWTLQGFEALEAVLGKRLNTWYIFKPLNI